MCLGDLGVVVGFSPVRTGRDVVVVRTDRGEVDATVLLAPDVRPGDRVVVHSGHVLEVLSPARADEAALLRGVGQHASRPHDHTKDPP